MNRQEIRSAILNEARLEKFLIDFRFDDSTYYNLELECEHIDEALIRFIKKNTRYYPKIYPGTMTSILVYIHIPLYYEPRL